MVLGESWWFLVVLAGFFVVLGGSLQFLVVFGGSWQFSVVLGGFWWFFVVIGGSC